MKYKPVERIVTVEFDKEDRGEGYEVRVTPEHFVIRYGDTITWVVQGLPSGLATSVNICNFRPIALCERVLRIRKGPRKGLVQHPALGFSASGAKAKGSFRRTVEAVRAELGRYKYDIYFKEQLLLDPDGEVKGPRH